METNFWFYTLSTISQTLAAIIALTATFVIFKLSQVNSRIKEEYDEIKLWIMPLFREIEIDQLTKLDESAMLKKLQDGIKKLDPNEKNLGVGGNIHYRLIELYKEVVVIYKRRLRPTNERIYDYLKEKERILNSQLIVRKTAFFKLLVSSSLTSLTIVGAIIFLPLYKSVINYTFAIIFALVGLTVIAVLYTAHSVWSIAHPQLR